MKAARHKDLRARRLARRACGVLVVAVAMTGFLGSATLGSGGAVTPLHRLFLAVITLLALVALVCLVTAALVESRSPVQAVTTNDLPGGPLRQTRPSVLLERLRLKLRRLPRDPGRAAPAQIPAPLGVQVSRGNAW